MKTVIVPVSGGKDSQVVLSLALAAGHKPVCVHQSTGFDHPLTYKQLIDMSDFYKVEIQHTISKHVDMFGFLRQAKYFPNSVARGCTQRLKQEPFAKWLADKGFNESNAEIWFGMRADESADRSDKYGRIEPNDIFRLGEVAAFYANKPVGRIVCKLPIVHWSTAQVFEHLRAEGAPINPLYERGHVRVGCYPCLLARKREWQLAGSDPVGRLHIEQLLALEEQWKAEGNPRKFIKVHRRWDVRAFVAPNDLQLADASDNDASECGYCSI